MYFRDRGCIIGFSHVCMLSIGGLQPILPRTGREYISRLEYPPSIIHHLGLLHTQNIPYTKVAHTSLRVGFQGFCMLTGHFIGSND